MKKALFLLSLLALLAFSGCVSDQEGSTGLAAAGQAADSTISVPLDDIGTEAKFFEYESSGKTVRFFAVKGSDGSIKTAFDACDVCFNSGKGYRQEGKNMICNNCGNKYPIDGLGTENRNPGGCWPSYLPNTVVGNEIVIEKSELEKGKAMFS